MAHLFMTNLLLDPIKKNAIEKHLANELKIKSTVNWNLAKWKKLAIKNMGK